ncbi:mitogen-activated protein kinase 7 [Platysternon megacephalum]|uniref:Mitogen-activated protein kinase 7 n=1 Tax=Platysternon megacephalum TaxID=55544 RepID=A0A4D9DWW4_9SAUR|nr:mitogen-activated protein kinase 7 [Platysternon megacephalum]
MKQIMEAEETHVIQKTSPHTETQSSTALTMSVHIQAVQNKHAAPSSHRALQQLFTASYSRPAEPTGSTDPLPVNHFRAHLYTKFGRAEQGFNYFASKTEVLE